MDDVLVQQLISERHYQISTIITGCEETLRLSYERAIPLRSQERRALLTRQQSDDFFSTLTKTKILLTPPLHRTVVLRDPTIPMPTTTLPRPADISLPLPFFPIPTRQIRGNPLPWNAVVRGVALCEGCLAAQLRSGEGVRETGGTVPLRRLGFAETFRDGHGYRITISQRTFGCMRVELTTYFSHPSPSQPQSYNQSTHPASKVPDHAPQQYYTPSPGPG